MSKTRARRVVSAFLLPKLKHLGVRGRLKFFILSNSLYMLDDAGVFAFSLVIRFKKKRLGGDVFLVLDLLKTGSKLDNRLLDFGTNLQGLFASELISTKNKPGCVEYVLLLKKGKEESFNLAEPFEPSANSKVIPLNSWYDWDYNHFCHMLLSGPTGAGKSFYLFYLIRQIEAIGGKMAVCDGKFDELERFADRVGNLKNARSVGDIVNIVSWVRSVMELRYRKNRTNARPLFLIVDEVASLGLALERKDLKVFFDDLKAIVLMGRGAGIHLILCLQRPSADVLDLAIRDNLAVRIGFGSLYKEAFLMVFGYPKSEDVLSKGIGEGYLSFNGEPVKAFYAPFLSLEGPAP